MILPNSALSWAATRSGLGLGDFMASLTPAKEQEILAAYNAWRADKGLQPVIAVEPANPEVKERQKAEPADALSSMMEAVANEIEQEEAAEAAELAHTMEEIDAIPVPEVEAILPDELEEELELDDQAEAETDPPADIARAEEAGPEPRPVGIDGDRAGEPEAAPYNLSRLPKEPDEGLYMAILSSCGGDIESLKAAVEAVLRDHSRRHRGTAAQRLFIQWLEEKRTPTAPVEE